MPNIKRRASTLEARIAEAEMRVPDQGMSDAMFEAFERAAAVMMCFCAADGVNTPEAIRGCLLHRGLSQVDAERYAGMTYSEARDEVCDSLPDPR